MEHSDTVVIPQLDLEDVNQAVALFGSICLSNPGLTRLVNTMGPLLFASLLVTVSEEYQADPEDSENLVPTKDSFEAEAQAIGWVRAVAQAIGTEYGERSVTPSDREVEADSEIAPITP